MRVVLATGLYPPDIGGPATYVEGLAEELRRRGHEVAVVAYGREESSADREIPVVRTRRDAPLPLRYARFFLRTFRAARRADLVYAQDPLSTGLPALAAARLARKRVVVKVVGDIAWEIARESGATTDSIEAFQTAPVGGLFGAARRARARVCRAAERVLVPSRYLAGLVRGWGVAPDRIDVVPNALAPAALARLAVDGRAARARLGFRDEELVVFSAGRLVPWKGFDRLVRALSVVRQRIPSARLVIAGAGPCADELARLRAAEGLEEAVRLAGPLDPEAMALHLRAADIVALATAYEGFSHFLLEALAAGACVVTTDAGGNPELVEDGTSGRIVPVESDAALVETLVALGGDAAARRRLGEGARRRALRFSWRETVDATVATLEAARAGRTPSARTEAGTERV